MEHQKRVDTLISELGQTLAHNPSINTYKQCCHTNSKGIIVTFPSVDVAEIAIKKLTKRTLKSPSITPRALKQFLKAGVYFGIERVLPQLRLSPDSYNVGLVNAYESLGEDKVLLYIQITYTDEYDCKKLWLVFGPTPNDTETVDDITRTFEQNNINEFVKITQNLPATDNSGGFDAQKMTKGNGLCKICSRKSTHICSGCKFARYCSKECQKQDWKTSHKKQCEFEATVTKMLLEEI